MNLADKDNNDDDDRVISSIHNKPTANSSKWEALKQIFFER